MNYTSTRGDAQVLSLADLVTRGTAGDGGLFVPESWPQPDRQTLHELLNGNYCDCAIRTLQLFGADSLPDGLLEHAIPTALERFGDAANPPLNTIREGLWSLELFHGPTLAFKDYALAPLAELIDGKLAHEKKRATILCATSGDTGAATASAFAGRSRVNAVVLFPAGGISEFQRRQMTTLGANNLLPLCVDGDFDDCQRIVKSLYQSDSAGELGYTAVNSINMARILLQTAYYFYAAGQINKNTGKQVRFIVPTGNFGNVYAAYVAKMLDAPIEQLTITSNENDVLPRLFESGSMQASQTQKTISPSMDIQVSSNFERLLWHIKEKSGSAVADAQALLAKNKRYVLSEAEMKRARQHFAAVRCSREDAFAAMQWMHREHDRTICPHSATAAHVVRHLNSDHSEVVMVETAHPAKFSSAVNDAIGEHPQVPTTAAHLLQAQESYTRVNADVAAVESEIRKFCG